MLFLGTVSIKTYTNRQVMLVSKLIYFCFIDNVGCNTTDRSMW